MSTTPNTLTSLLEQIKRGEIDLNDALPTFGGEEPADTDCVWSWDETHILVGTCAHDARIVTRDHYSH